MNSYIDWFKKHKITEVECLIPDNSGIPRGKILPTKKFLSNTGIPFFIPAFEPWFIITDFKNEINVVYSGAVPNLFEEGKGVVAEGFLKDKNYFLATKILAKHDENYMPPEVKEAIGDK